MDSSLFIGVTGYCNVGCSVSQLSIPILCHGCAHSNLYRSVRDRQECKHNALISDSGVVMDVMTGKQFDIEAWTEGFKESDEALKKAIKEKTAQVKRLQTEWMSAEFVRQDLTPQWPHGNYSRSFLITTLGCQPFRVSLDTTFVIVLLTEGL